MTNSRKRILITGMAGFIGSHLARALTSRGDHVVGIDNFNPYYDPQMKRRRIEGLAECVEGDIQDTPLLEALLKTHAITHVVHLAAQAGVRYSLTHPDSYRINNLDGFFSVLQALRTRPQIPLIFASSSSVYGLNEKIPFSETDPTESPASIYAATKKAAEALAFSYHHLYGIPVTALRYFTVYGPMGRPDMAILKFAHAITQGRPIEVYNQGKMKRDFTYIDDIIEGTISAIDHQSSFEVFNLGKGSPDPLLDMIDHLEQILGKKAQIKMLPMQPGEVTITYADISKARRLLNFEPKVPLIEGIRKTMQWFTSSNCA